MKSGFKMRAARLLGWSLCLLVLLVLGAALWPQPTESGLAIHFMGFTNAPGQSQSAMFVVTNISRSRMSLAVAEPQVSTDGVWPKNIVVLSKFGIRLERGESTNVTVAVPDRGEAWRMPIICFYELSTPGHYVRRGQNLLRTAKAGSLSGWNEGYHLSGYTNFSEHMKFPKAEPNGLASGTPPIRSETNGTSSATGSR